MSELGLNHRDWCPRPSSPDRPVVPGAVEGIPMGQVYPLVSLSIVPDRGLMPVANPPTVPSSGPQGCPRKDASRVCPNNSPCPVSDTADAVSAVSLGSRGPHLFRRLPHVGARQRQCCGHLDTGAV